MEKLSKIVKFLDAYLKNSDIKDYSFNGLQFEGKPDVKKIMFAVDAGIDTFKMAVSKKADMVVVHHGQYWKGANPSVTGSLKKRLEILFSNDISLYASHLPLDRHPECGNNAELMNIIGAKIKEEFLFEADKNISFLGEFPKRRGLDTIVSKLEKTLNTECRVLRFGPDTVKRVALCSGGGGISFFEDALRSSSDLYITGEEVEIYHSAKDAGMNVIFAGHHATETTGVKALSKIVKKRLNVDTFFCDIPTGI